MADVVSQLKQDLTEALKGKDRTRASVIRMLLAEIKTAETSAGRKKITADEAVAAYAKRLRKTVEEYCRLGQAERAEQHEGELQIVASYLPELLSREEIEEVVAKVVAEHGLTASSDVGQAMRLVMGQYGDRVEGRVVQEIVRRRLGAG